MSCSDVDGYEVYTLHRGGVEVWRTTMARRVDPLERVVRAFGASSAEARVGAAIMGSQLGQVPLIRLQALRDTARDALAADEIGRMDQIIFRLVGRLLALRWEVFEDTGGSFFVSWKDVRDAEVHGTVVNPDTGGEVPLAHDRIFPRFTVMKPEWPNRYRPTKRTVWANCGNDLGPAGVDGDCLLCLFGRLATQLAG